MKKHGMLSASALAIACAMFSSSAYQAQAADLPGSTKDYYEPSYSAPAISPVWGGFYVGGHIGAGWSDERNQSISVFGGGAGGGGSSFLDDGDDGVGPIGGAGGTFGAGDGATGAGGGVINRDVATDDGTSVIAGVHIGYNWQWNNVVAGIEGDASFNNNLDEYLASLRARLGVATDRTLLYITGGIAFRGGEDQDVVGIAAGGGEGGDGFFFGGDGGNGAAGGFAIEENRRDDETGWVAGAGVDHMLSHNVSVGLEGLYYGFDGDDTDITVLRARLTMHLNGGSGSYKEGIVATSPANWSGLYAGLNAGVGLGDEKNIDERARTEGGVGGGGGSFIGAGGGGGGGGGAAVVTLEDAAGVLGGAHIGYNWQMGSTVIGVEADGAFVDDSLGDYLASARLRLGYAFDQFLVYGTAGVAFTRDSRSSLAVTAGGDGGDAPFFGVPGAGGTQGTIIEDEEESSNVGFVVGAGMEVKLSETVSFGMEGLYYGFGGDDSVIEDNFFSEGESDIFVARGRITYHLNDPAPEPLK